VHTYSDTLFKFLKFFCNAVKTGTEIYLTEREKMKLIRLEESLEERVEVDIRREIQNSSKAIFFRTDSETKSETPFWVGTTAISLTPTGSVNKTTFFSNPAAHMRYCCRVIAMYEMLETSRRDEITNTLYLFFNYLFFSFFFFFFFF